MPTLAALRDRADAEHERAEDDRLDHHLDQGDEGRADPLQADGEVGEDEADDGPEDDGDDHRDVEVVGAVALDRRPAGWWCSWFLRLRAAGEMRACALRHILRAAVTAVTLVVVEFTPLRSGASGRRVPERVRHNARMPPAAAPRRESPVARQILLLQVLVVLVLVVTATALAALDARRDTRDAARDEAVSVARRSPTPPPCAQALGTPDPTRDAAALRRGGAGRHRRRLRRRHGPGPAAATPTRPRPSSARSSSATSAARRAARSSPRSTPARSALDPLGGARSATTAASSPSSPWASRSSRVDEQLRRDLPGIALVRPRRPGRRARRGLADQPAPAPPDARAGRARDHPDVRVLPRRAGRRARGARAGRHARARCSWSTTRPGGCCACPTTSSASRSPTSGCRPGWSRPRRAAPPAGHDLRPRRARAAHQLGPRLLGRATRWARW